MRDRTVEPAKLIFDVVIALAPGHVCSQNSVAYQSRQKTVMFPNDLEIRSSCLSTNKRDKNSGCERSRAFPPWLRELARYRGAYVSDASSRRAHSNHRAKFGKQGCGVGRVQPLLLS